MHRADTDQPALNAKAFHRYQQLHGHLLGTYNIKEMRRPGRKKEKGQLPVIRCPTASLRAPGLARLAHSARPSMERDWRRRGTHTRNKRTRQDSQPILGKASPDLTFPSTRKLLGSQAPRWVQCTVPLEVLPYQFPGGNATKNSSTSEEDHVPPPHAMTRLAPYRWLSFLQWCPSS